MFDDTAVSSSDNNTTTKQVTFNTTSTIEIPDNTQEAEVVVVAADITPKKSSRVAWQEHVEFME